MAIAPGAQPPSEAREVIAEARFSFTPGVTGDETAGSQGKGV